MKILRIEQCLDCPYIQPRWDPEEAAYCGKIARRIMSLDGFPEWCPLEDAPSEFCECEHPLPATRTTIGVCIICDKRIEDAHGSRPR